MKTKISLLLAFCLCLQSFGQQSNLDEPDFDPCSSMNPSNFFENGLQSSSIGTRIVANDFVVRAGDVFTINRIIFNFFTTDAIVAVEVAYYNDDNGVPGTEIGAVNNIDPVSSIDIGDFGLVIHEVIIDLPDFDFVAQPDEDTTFWVSITANNASGDDVCYWEISTVSLAGNPSAFNDNGAGWEQYDNGGGPPWDGVYEFIGDCLLDSEDATISEFKVFPNPATDQLHIVTSNSIEISNMTLYDIAGKQMDVSSINNTLDVSQLPIGFYILKIISEEGVTSRKVVKK